MAHTGVIRAIDLYFDKVNYNRLKLNWLKPNSLLKEVMARVQATPKTP